jgi:hypothetical protein
VGTTKYATSLGVRQNHTLVFARLHSRKPITILASAGWDSCQSFCQSDFRVLSPAARAGKDDYTIREWVDAPGVQYVPVDGELELLPGSGSSRRPHAV